MTSLIKGPGVCVIVFDTSSELTSLTTSSGVCAAFDNSSWIASSIGSSVGCGWASGVLEEKKLETRRRGFLGSSGCVGEFGKLHMRQKREKILRERWHGDLP